MNWLERLKNETRSDVDTAAPVVPGFGGFGVPTPGPFEEKKVRSEGFGGFGGRPPAPFVEKTDETGGFGGFGVPVRGHIENSMSPVQEIFPTPAHRCWPHADAITTSEGDTFTSRLVLFKAKGQTSSDAEMLTGKLLIRDREGDDRHTCLECSHLSGWNGRRQCRGLQYAGMGGPLVSTGQVALLQRCGGFKAAASSESNKRTSP